MPYKSEKQRRYMYAQHPDIAAKWDAKGANYVDKSKERANKRKSRTQMARISKRNSRRSGRK